MKKIISAFAVALTACAVNAASLNWAVSQVQNSDGVSGVAGGYQCYLFLTAAEGNVLSFVDGAALTSIAAVEASIKDGTFTGVGAYHSALTQNTGMAPTATGVSTSFGAGDSLSGFAVIFDAASFADADNYIITDIKSAAWTSSTGAKTLAFGSQANATWQAVPEPTSGLLMLVGLAGLALRRRRA